MVTPPPNCNDSLRESAAFGGQSGDGVTHADCLFCKIARREIPSTVVYESEGVLGFTDIHPQAPVHDLFIPKIHVAGVGEIPPGIEAIIGDLVGAAHHVARQKKIADSGYRLVINRGREGGQTVDHLHVHLLGGRRMTWPPG